MKRYKWCPVCHNNPSRYRNGWCSTCHDRWKRTGSPYAIKLSLASLLEKLRADIDRLGIKEVCRRSEIGEAQIRGWFDHKRKRVEFDVADRICTRMGYDPNSLWPEEWTELIYEEEVSLSG